MGSKHRGMSWDPKWVGVFLTLSWAFAYWSTSTALGFSTECIFFVGLYALSAKIAIALAKLVTHLILPAHSQATDESLVEMERIRREYMDKRSSECEWVQLSSTDGAAVIDAMKVYHPQRSAEPSQQRWMLWFNGNGN